MREYTPGQMESGRRTARRRMAVASFIFLIVVAASIVAALILSSHRADIAAALSVASVVLVGLLTCFVTIVLGYLGFSSAEKMFGRKRDGSDGPPPISNS